MHQICLNGKRMMTIRSAHRHLSQRFGFPCWYGHNLDALWDLLTSISRPTAIRLSHPEALTACYADYGERLLDVLQQAATANPRLTLTLVK